MKRKGKFRVYKTPIWHKLGWVSIEWYFNLHAKNGKIIATSETYKSKQACLKGIASVAKNAPDAVVEIM